jgi:hypothetical protein
MNLCGESAFSLKSYKVIRAPLNREPCFGVNHASADRRTDSIDLLISGGFSNETERQVRGWMRTRTAPGFALAYVNCPSIKLHPTFGVGFVMRTVAAIIVISVTFAAALAPVRPILAKPTIFRLAWRTWSI